MDIITGEAGGCGASCVIPFQPARATLGRVVVEIYIIDQRNNFAIRIVATGGAHVMGTLQFATAWTFVRICCYQRIVGTALAAAGTGDLTLRDSHVITSRYLGDAPSCAEKRSCSFREHGRFAA